MKKLFSGLNLNFKNDHFDNNVILWTTFSPNMDHISDGINDYQDYINKKNQNKEIYNHVIDEIDNEVAYRPGKMKMLEAKNDFMNYLDYQNQAF